MKVVARCLIAALAACPFVGSDIALAQDPTAGSGQSAQAAVTTEPLGVLPPVTAEVEAKIPNDCLVRLPQGDFVIGESAAVRYTKGPRLLRVADEPGQGQFRARLDGGLRFSKQDVGKAVAISYEYCPRRVAILSVECDTNYQDAGPILRQALSGELGKRGFVIVPEDDVADAAAESGGLSEWKPERLAAVGLRLQAAYLLRPGVGAEEGRVLTGSIGQVETVGGHNTITTTPVVRNMMSVAVAMDVITGDAGTVLTRRVRSGSARVRFRRFAPTRQSLIEELATALVRDWREVH